MSLSKRLILTSIGVAFGATACNRTALDACNDFCDISSADCEAGYADTCTSGCEDLYTDVSEECDQAAIEMYDCYAGFDWVCDGGNMPYSQDEDLSECEEATVTWLGVCDISLTQ